MIARNGNTWCAREADLWEAIAAGRWPDATDADLWAHVNGCPSCRDVALVSSSLSFEGASARREATPPSGAIVWWRAQVRARQEAAAAAARPITIAQGLALASVLGLTVAFAGAAMAWMHAPLAAAVSWVAVAAQSAGDLATIGVTTRWMLVPLGVALASLLFAPIAIYLITADE